MPRDRRPPSLVRTLLVLLALATPAPLLLAAGVQAAAAAAAAAEGALVQEDRWGPISTPVPPAAVERFEAAVVGYASLRGEVVAPLEEVHVSPLID